MTLANAEKVAQLELSLGDFVKYLLVLLQRNGIPFKLEDERVWHELLYALKMVPQMHSGRPQSLADLKFDWDGPYPKSQELSRSFTVLRTNSLTCSSPAFTDYKILEGIKRRWAEEYEKLPANIKEFLNIALVIATERLQ